MVPGIEPSDIERVMGVLRSGQLVQGPEVAELEARVSACAGTSHAVAVTNGTATLHLTLLALGIGPGDEVVVPAFSYIATANAVELTGARAVFAETDAHTFNVLPSSVEAAITERTRAIMPVHEFGLSCQIDAILGLGERYGIPVVEDAACALGATYAGRQAGGWGRAGSFSLHPRKSVTSGEGGVVTTNDAALADTLRILRNHGVGTAGGAMDFVTAGFNCRMTDMQAALVNGQIERLPQILAHKARIAQTYLRSLDGSLMQLPVVPDGQNHTWQTFHVVLPGHVSRNQVIETLRQRGIGSNLGAQCIPATRHYALKYGIDAAAMFPNAHRAYCQGLAIPMHMHLTEEDAQIISKEINKAVENA